MSDLYDSDFVIWSEQQADALRRLSRGERANDIDWPNLIEEVESLGLSELHAVQSLLQRALEHFLKAAAWPAAHAVPKWLDEAGAFLDDAGYRWAPSMAQRIDLAKIYRKALRRVDALTYTEGPPGPLPIECPVRLADLIGGEVANVAPHFHLRPDEAH